jgi:hypothetical protein
MIFLVQQLLGNRLKLYFYAYVVSIFFTFVNIQVVSDFMEKFEGTSVQKRTKSYLSEEYAEGYFEAQTTTNWYIKYKYTLLKILVGSSFFWIFYFKRKLLKTNNLMVNLFCIGLMYMAFANITSSVPSMLRFFYIGYMAVSMMLFLFFQLFPFKRRPDWYKFVSLFIVIVTCLVEVRVGLQNMTIATLAGNPFTFGFFDESQSALDWIKR